MFPFDTCNIHLTEDKQFCNPCETISPLLCTVKLKQIMTMKMKCILAGMMLACMGITAQAQDAKTEEPKGKAIVQVFGNFHTGF
ncbi:MAG: hypothetical protein IKW19_06850, partial [Akkermansia sp.]|nr:hypothetical protein [Akkermansia sp.]